MGTSEFEFESTLTNPYLGGAHVSIAQPSFASPDPHPVNAIQLKRNSKPRGRFMLKLGELLVPRLGLPLACPDDTM